MTSPSSTTPPGLPEQNLGARGWQALAVPSFRWFLAGSLLSNIGNQMRTVTVGWEVYERTGDALSLGIIGLVLALPVLLLALPAGVAADRYSRRAILLVAVTGLALCGFGLAWASTTEAPLPIVYALLLGTGAFRALGWPALSAIVTQLVPLPLFANAATWRSVAFQTAATLGPLLGGVLLARTSPAALYVIDGLTSVVFAVCILLIPLGPQQRSRTTLRSWHSIAEGLRFVRYQKIILSTITLDMVAVLFGGATALLPLYAKDVLHVGTAEYGWLRAMPSVGAIAMGLLLTTRPAIRRTGPALLAAVAVFGVATIVFGASTSFPLSLIALAVLGAADSISVVIRATLLQLLTPDAMRGRVAAVNAIFINTSNEVGEFESGVTAYLFGPILAVCGGGVATLVSIFVIVSIWPQVAKLGPLDELRPDTNTSGGAER